MILIYHRPFISRSYYIGVIDAFNYTDRVVNNLLWSAPNGTKLKRK